MRECKTLIEQPNKSEEKKQIEKAQERANRLNHESANRLNQWIDEGVISIDTAQKANPEAIDESVRRIPLGNLSANRQKEWADKRRTILGEPKGADNREGLKKENIIKIFTQVIKEINQRLSEQQEYASAKPKPHIEGVILFGSRMDKSRKPRPESDIDCVIVLSRRTKNLSGKIRKSFIECVQNYFAAQGIELKNIEQGFVSQCAFASDFRPVLTGKNNVDISVLTPSLMSLQALLNKNTELLFPDNPKLKQGLEEAIAAKRKAVHFKYQ
ncbi:MAG: nucleotidyltransferase domain-containing protein [Candidatus Jacksonbacteria bacterium]